MQIGLYELVYIITGIFGAYTVYKYMEVFFDSKKTIRKIEVLTYSAYYIFITALYLVVDIPAILITANLGAFFSLTYNYESTIQKRITSAFLTYLILAITELIAFLLTGYINFSLFAESNYSSVYGMIVCRVLSYIVVLILGNFKNIKKGATVPTSYWLCIVLIPVSTLYLILLLFQSEGLGIIQVMTGTVILFMINFVTFFLYDAITAAMSEKMKAILTLEQNKYYEKQFDLIKASVQTTSMIRHDLKNHLIAIRSYIENGNNEESLDYIQDIMANIRTKANYVASGNMIVDSIINFKFQEAEQNGVKPSIDLNIPDNLEMPSFDMTVILGNLLDNAIKAAAEVKDKAFIQVKIKYDKGRLLIQTDNPFNGEIKEENGKLMTTKTDTENHGIGLENIKRVIQKYNGSINVDYNENIFTATLLLYVD